MHPEITAVRPLPGYRLWLRFSDGAEGEVDLSTIARTGVFATWNDPARFQQVFIDSAAGTVAWPGGIDLDPYQLYTDLTGAALPGASSSRAAS